MKKAIFTLATPLLLAATAANAATVIKTDNSSLDIFGRAKFTGTHTADGNDSSSSTSPSARFGVKGDVKNENGTSAFFHIGWELQSSREDIASNNVTTAKVADPDNPTNKDKRISVVTDAGSDNITSRYVFVGLGSETLGKISFGQNDTPFYTMVTSTTDIPYYNSMEGTAGTYGYRFAPNLALYSNTFGKLSVQASYQFQTAQHSSKQILDYYGAGLNTANFQTQDNAYSAGAIYALTDKLNLHGGFAYQGFINGADKADYGVALDYTINNLYLGTVFTYSKENDVKKTANRKAAEIAASYNMGKYTFDASYAYGKQRSDVATTSTTDSDGVTTVINNNKTYGKAINLDVQYHVFSNVTVAAGISHLSDGGNEYDTSLNYSF